MTKSLAILENRVHLNPPVRFKCVAFHLESDAALLEEVSLRKLRPDWRTAPPPRATQQIGDCWMRELRSAVLAIPSVIIPSAGNYPDFKENSIGKPQPFAFDPRLIT